MKRFLFLILIFCLTLSFRVVYAQNNATEELSESEMKSISEMVIQKVDVFQQQLKVIVNQQNSANTKDEAIKTALELFIGSGLRYQIKTRNNLNNEIVEWHDPVTMQTTSKRRGLLPPKPMTSYLASLKSNAATHKIKISQAQSVRVSNLMKADATGNLYVAIATYFQTYMREYEWGTYIDYNEKAMKVYIEKQTVLTPQGELSVWNIRLGDVKCIDFSNYN